MGHSISITCSIKIESGTTADALKRAAIVAERMEKDNPPLKVESVWIGDTPLLGQTPAQAPESVEVAEVAEEKPAPAKAKKTHKAKKPEVVEEAPETEDPTPSGDEVKSSGESTGEIEGATLEDLRGLINTLVSLEGNVAPASKILNGFGHKSAGKVPENDIGKVAFAFQEAIDAKA